MPVKSNLPYPSSGALVFSSCLTASTIRHDQKNAPKLGIGANLGNIQYFKYLNLIRNPKIKNKL